MNESGYADLLNTNSINTDSLSVGLLNLPNLDANSVAYIDSSNNLADIILTDGQLVIGKTSNARYTNEVIVTNGPGTLSLYPLLSQSQQLHHLHSQV